MLASDQKERILLEVAWMAESDSLRFVTPVEDEDPELEQAIAVLEMAEEADSLDELLGEVEFSEVFSDLLEELGAIDFAAKGGKRSKAPNCNPGKSWSCGYTCLPMSKKRCGSGVSQKAAAFAEKLADWIGKIPGLKGLSEKIGGKKKDPQPLNLPPIKSSAGDSPPGATKPPNPKSSDPIDDETEAIATGKRPKIEDSDREDFKERINKSAPQSFDDYADEIKSKIPPPKLEEAVALRVYTSDEYSGMNAALRKGRHEDMDEDQRKYLESSIKLATAGLEQMPSYTGTVHRAAELPLEVIQKYKTGETIVERGFTSTSSSKSAISDFETFANVSYVIDSTKGKSVKKLSEHAEEEEILYPPGTQFKILNVEENNGKYTVYMRDD